MGNSEVGHLNLGAGAVVMQDLTRIDEAVRGRRAGRRTRCCATPSRAPSACTCSGWSPTAACTRASSHLEALIELAPTLERPGSRRCTRSPTGATRCPTSGAGFLETVEGWMATPAPGGSARSSAATTRWTATGAGTGSSSPTTCSSTGAPSTRRTRRCEAARGAYERGETDEFIKPVLVGEEARIRPGDSVLAFNFRPDRMREITRALAEPGFDEIDRGGAGAGRALRDDDRVRGGLAVSGRVPAGAARRRRCRR